MTFRETLRDSAVGDVIAPVAPDRPRRIWGTDGRLDSHHANEAVRREDLPVTTTMTQAIARALLPISVMIGIAILIKGYTDTGDGFSAGVILSLGAVIQISCFGIGVIDRIPILRYSPIAAYVGIVIALAIAFLPPFFGQPLFTHWPPVGEKPLHFGTLEIITAVAFDISVCLLVFGFVVGTMILLARTASVASTQQAQTAERQRPPGEQYASRSVQPGPRRVPTGDPATDVRRVDDGARRPRLPD